MLEDNHLNVSQSRRVYPSDDDDDDDVIKFKVRVCACGI